MKCLNSRLTPILGTFFLLAAPAIAAPITAKVPTCETVSRAIVAAYGPVASFKDDTAAVHQLHGHAPYTVYRACRVYLPGHKVPLSITFEGPLNRQFLEAMVRFGAQHGSAPKKLDGTGYGDLAYLTPQRGGGNGLSALVGNIVVTITSWAHAQDTENMAEHIIKLM